MDAAQAVGSLLDGRYRLLRQIGAGAGGVVYEAENIHTLHRVAIKVLHAHLVRHEGMLERFHQEAQAAGRIRSDQIVRAFDLGQLPDGSAYLVMERLEGQDLGSWSATVGRVDPAVLAPIALEILRALGAAHAAGIVHRDVKPDNVFLTDARDGVLVKIIDFGVSRFLVDGEPKQAGPGVVVGSPAYMSPEQAKGEDADARADLFSVGVILFECLTGRLPFDDENFNDLMFKIVLEDAPSPIVYRPGLDPEFAAIVHRALKRDRTERFQSAPEFHDAIAKWMEDTGLGAVDATFGTLSSRVMTTGTPLHRESLGLPASDPAVRGPVETGKRARHRLPLADSTEPDVMPPAKATSEPEAPPREKKRSRAALFAGIAVVVLLACGVAGRRLLGASPKPPPSPVAAVASAPAEPISTATPPASPATAPADQAPAAVAPASASSPAVAVQAPRFSPPQGGRATPRAGPSAVSTAAASTPTRVDPTSSAPQPFDKVEGRGIRTRL